MPPLLPLPIVVLRLPWVNRLSNNHAMQQQMAQMKPQILKQMQNSAVQQLMSNPEALKAIMQIK